MSRSAAGSPGVNLMPLLDVLLCTMGTLIVVLGALNREARYHPAKRLPGKAASAAKADELKNAKEDLEFMVQQMTTAHEKTLVDLQNSRVRLSGIEDTSRQLEDKFHSMEAAVKNFQASDAADSAKRDQLRVALVQLNTKRMQLDNELQKGRANAHGRQPVYAVVPFEGMYKTSRRPIYIECRGDTVILQPEGIAFTATDFLGPGGPGNPLAAALRAAQEYWRNAPRNDPNMPNEPYPLLLVRPDGIIAYYLVRDAMTSWDAELGYELIGADWKLDFPMQVEPRLKEMETRAVADARDRLQWLAQASPELFQRKASKVQYHVSPFRGGAVRDGGPSLGNDPFADDPLGGFGKAGSNPNAGVANNMGSANGVPGGINGGGGMGSGNLASGGGRYPEGRGNAAFGFSGQGSNSRGGTGSGGNSLGTGPGGSNVAGGLNPGGINSPGGGSATGIGNGLGGSPGGLAGGLPGDANNAFGGSGTGSNGQNGGGPELAAVGPRYAGAGNNLGGGDGGQFTPGMSVGGQFAGGQLAGQGSGGGSSGQSGASGSGNGMSGPPNSKSGNYQGGAAGSLSSSGGMPGGGLTSSEYGGVMLPGAAGGYMSAGSMTGSTGAAASGVAGAPGAGSGMSGSAMSGGAGASAGGDSSASGSSGGGNPAGGGAAGGAQSATAGAGGDANPSAGGMPSLTYNMTPQQQETFEQQQLQQQQQSSTSQRSAKMHRQRNWALPNNNTSSVPIQRPIRVECWNDRLVLLPDTRDAQAEVIPLPPRTTDAVDQLVAAVRTYTKTWGIAGRGMYWKPQLVLEVTPNGEGRAKDLTEILADSGWDVKRK